MWDLENRTPFAAERTFVRGIDGTEIWVVAVRATFDLHPGGALFLSEEQVPVARGPEWEDDPATSPLRWESDLLRTKTGTDVLLHGEAVAPAEVAVPEVVTRLRVGPVDKSLRVVGPRRFRIGILGLRPGKPQPFVTQPLSYRHTFGGTHLDEDGEIREQHEENPVGIGVVPIPKHPAPQILGPDGRHDQTVGYGPIAATWLPRRSLAGTYDDSWAQTRQPLPPEDFQDEFFSSAPIDQQVPGFLKGGEPVELDGFHAEGPISFSLPRILLSLVTRFEQRKQHHTPDLHSVIFETHLMRMTMVWHSALPCHQDVQRLIRTTVDVEETSGFRNPWSPETDWHA